MFDRFFIPNIFGEIEIGDRVVLERGVSVIVTDKALLDDLMVGKICGQDKSVVFPLWEIKYFDSSWEN